MATLFLKKYWNKLLGPRAGEAPEKPLRREAYQKKYEMRLREWLLYHQKEIVFDQVTWMGTPILKNVLDAWIYQEIIADLRPDVIVEIGSRYGGSTKYFANLLDIIGSGTVISIDIDRSDYNLIHDRVIELTGNSSEPDIISETAHLCHGKSVMVIQDGDHTKKQVLKDLENYSPFVSLNSYFIVEDGIVDLFRHGDGLGFQEPGPLAAVEDFLKQHPDFINDTTRERYHLTYNPKGFLKRIAL